jgi:hypothetical protein
LPRRAALRAAHSLPAVQRLPPRLLRSHALRRGHVRLYLTNSVQTLPRGFLLPRELCTARVRRGAVLLGRGAGHGRVQRALHRGARLWLPRGLGRRRGWRTLPRGLFLRGRVGAPHRVRVPWRMRRRGAFRGPLSRQWHRVVRGPPLWIRRIVRPGAKMHRRFGRQRHLQGCYGPCSGVKCLRTHRPCVSNCVSRNPRR